MSQTSNLNTSPCSRLNGDVLREIFIHCIIGPPFPRDDSYPKNISTCFVAAGYYKPSTRDHPQVSVSRVCSSWRDIALHTPQLWNNIRIAGLTEANLRNAREYLSRAENVLVCIKINQMAVELPGQDLRSQLTDFLSSYRIQTLYLTVYENMPRFPLVLTNLPQRSVAELESLVIFGHHDQEAQMDLNDTRYPKLAVLRIRGTFQISSFNSSSLRIYDGQRHSMTVTESWDFLSRFPSLEECRLSIKRSRINGGWRPVSMPQIRLQRLRILALTSESEEHEIPFSTFTEVLSLPLLEKLSLREAATTWSSTAFQSLAHRSNYFPHLSQFRLSGPRATSIVDAGIVLASMPWLKTACICPCLNTNQVQVIFDDLALDGLASGSLTPRLHFLRVGCISNTSLFLDMVESRMKNAQMSSNINQIPALFRKVDLSTFDQGLRERVICMQQRGIPVNCW